MVYLGSGLACRKALIFWRFLLFPPLSYAAQKGRIEVIELLLNRQDVCADFQDKRDITPLSYATQKSNLGVLKTSLELGDVCAGSKDDRSRTPSLPIERMVDIMLHGTGFASEEDYQGVIDMLLRRTAL